MSNKLSVAPLVIAVGIAIVVQLALIGLDCQQTPIKVAKNFTRAYFYLDADMRDYLCADLAEKGQVVNDYLIQKETEASQRGLDTKYLRHKFLHLHASIVTTQKDSMKVHLSGTTRVCINPAFMLVGKLFSIGRDYPVDATIELVKENDQWRVCGTPFGLTPQAPQA
ncbi:MAG: hypothetical protein PVH87_27945 [Desulfobacteraceae bacterium]|jgi:hypothetical protein